MNNFATGLYSHAEGHNVHASGKAAHAEGNGTESCYMTFGARVTGSANATTYILTWDSEEERIQFARFLQVNDCIAIHSNGNLPFTAYSKILAINDNSTIVVDKTLSASDVIDQKVSIRFGSAIGDYSHSEGNWSRAIGTSSHAEGNQTIATGEASHAEGSNTYAYGQYSHAEGSLTIANAFSSHAEGNQTEASGHCAHAEGRYTCAKKSSAHAEGYNTIAAASSQHVQGEYNIEDTAGIHAHIVGNGSVINDSIVRSNAHTVDWDGNARFAGNVYVNGTGTDDLADAKIVATQEYVDNAVIMPAFYVIVTDDGSGT